MRRLGLSALSVALLLAQAPAHAQQAGEDPWGGMRRRGAAPTATTTNSDTPAPATPRAPRPAAQPSAVQAPAVQAPAVQAAPAQTTSASVQAAAIPVPRPRPADAPGASAGALPPPTNFGAVPAEPDMAEGSSETQSPAIAEAAVVPPALAEAPATPDGAQGAADAPASDVPAAASVQAASDIGVPGAQTPASADAKSAGAASPILSLLSLADGVLTPASLTALAAFSPIGPASAAQIDVPLAPRPTVVATAEPGVPARPTPKPDTPPAEAAKPEASKADAPKADAKTEAAPAAPQAPTSPAPVVQAPPAQSPAVQSPAPVPQTAPQVAPQAAPPIAPASAAVAPQTPSANAAPPSDPPTAAPAAVPGTPPVAVGVAAPDLPVLPPVTPRAGPPTSPAAASAPAAPPSAAAPPPAAASARPVAAPVVSAPPPAPAPVQAAPAAAAAASAAANAPLGTVEDSPGSKRAPLWPQDLVRALRRVQDSMAQGSTNAVNAQRDLILRIEQEFAAADPSIWEDPHNARAAVTYFLSGGNPAVLRRIMDTQPGPAIDPRLLRGTLAYLEGREDEALRQLKDIDARALPPSLGGQVALAQAALHLRKDPAKSAELLAVARVLAPGTLVEEAALRRAVLVAAQAGDLVQFESLSRQYLFRFRNSVYAGNFRQRFAASLSRLGFGNDPQQLARLEQILEMLEPDSRRDMELTLARAAVVQGRTSTANFAAERALSTTEGGTAEAERAKLYRGASLAPSADTYGEALNELKSVDRGLLAPADAALLDAASAAAENVKRATENAALAPEPPANALGASRAPARPPEPAGPLTKDEMLPVLEKARAALAQADASLKGGPR